MKIESITATPVTIAFKEPEYWSQGVRQGATTIIVQVLTDKGIIGVGESVPAPSPEVTMAAIDSARPILIGKDPRQIGARWLDVESKGGFRCFAHTGNAALAGIEIACWDILGKLLNAPVHALFGGAIRSEVPFMGFVQHTTPQKIEVDARRLVEAGYTTLYTKVGMDMASDVAAVAALRRGGGDKVNVRCDPNEAWTPSHALRMARALAEFDLQFIEQPLHMRAISELAELRRRSPVPIAANQSSWLNADILDILRVGAADVIVTDPWQAGGLANFQRAAALCETACLPLVYHGIATLSIAIQAAMAVLSTSTACFYANQMYNHMTSDDVVTEPVQIRDGNIAVCDKPGIGVELDEAKLEQYHEVYRQRGYDSAYGHEGPEAARTFFVPNQ
ncbi:MAG: mandelate racemase/muconate lactonizing enzyme family protein [Pirellulaceae bacterium]|jgi:L-alanine-DL-glutamate epimerase-like enolase superfamily enzyme|nr:mandelate racemase/muconate lactonizing enzyme family protein [Pirellulaceae bacterium]